MLTQILDKGGRRFGFDRRQFTYNGHIPERRSGIEQRQVSDRRSLDNAFQEEERRAVFLMNIDHKN